MKNKKGIINAISPISKYKIDSLKIFVGSWNVKFKEFNKEFFISQPDSDIKTSNLRSSLSFTEGFFSSNFRDETILHAESSSSLLESCLVDFETKIHSKKKVIKNEASTEPLNDWIKPHDILVVAFQEIVFEDIIDAITIFLNNQIGINYKRLESPDLKISGYGEGALSNTKSTSMVIWVREDRVYPNGPIKFFRACKVSFGFLKGSKGAVSASLELFGQKICFIGCHLPASSSVDRKLACEIILKKLGENYIGRKNNLDEFFSHIIWAGDFNSRLQGIKLYEAMELLKNLKIKELLEYDELLRENRKQIRGLNFLEEPINFIPSYKKLESRGLLDFKDTDWIIKHYSITPPDKWYKKNKIREQVPSWTDRILFWSDKKYSNSLQPICNSYKTISEEHQFSPLMTSDHSPISCEFIFSN